MLTNRLTELIEIQTLSATTDSTGVSVETYLPFKTLYVSILNDNGTG